MFRIIISLPTLSFRSFWRLIIESFKRLLWLHRWRWFVFILILLLLALSAFSSSPRSLLLPRANDCSRVHPGATPLFSSPTPAATEDFTCPAGTQPDGYGTVTPSSKWLLNCSQCITPVAPTDDGFPTLDLTPWTPDGTSDGTDVGGTGTPGTGTPGTPGTPTATPTPLLYCVDAVYRDFDCEVNSNGTALKLTGRGDIGNDYHKGYVARWGVADLSPQVEFHVDVDVTLEVLPGDPAHPYDPSIAGALVGLHSDWTDGCNPCDTFDFLVSYEGTFYGTAWPYAVFQGVNEWGSHVSVDGVVNVYVDGYCPFDGCGGTATPTPAPGGYCSVVEPDDGDDDGCTDDFCPPDPWIDDPVCAGLPEFTIPLGWLDAFLEPDLPDIVVPALEICFIPIYFGIMRFYSQAIDLDLILFIIAAAMLVRWALRSV